MNLSTTYLGIKLRTPLVPSASPLSANIDDVKQMEDAGAAAVFSPRSLRNKSATNNSSWIIT